MRLPVQVRSSPQKKEEFMTLTVTVHMKAFEGALLRQAFTQVRTLVRTPSHMYCVTVPSRVQRFTVLQSPHIDKKSREQFELRTHKGFVRMNLSMHELNALVQRLKSAHFLGVQLCIQTRHTSFLRKEGLEPSRTVCSTPSR